MRLVILSGLAYFVLDVPVMMTQILPPFVGIKNFLPFTLGLFFGGYGVIGCIAGCVVSAVVMVLPISETLYECWCIAVMGAGIFYGWHAWASLTKQHHIIAFKRWTDYARYLSLLLILSLFCFNITASLSCIITGIFIGLPVNILFSSLLYVQPVLPMGKNIPNDAEFCILPDAESLEGANEILEDAGIKKGVKMKRIIEIQSCIEELTIRILKAIPGAKISVSVILGDAISARLKYDGEKYNPFKIEKDEDEIDIMSLKIIKHRAIRVSYSYSEGVNEVHAVV